ncbi:MAG: methyltransferase domain-containing protein [Pseudomonadota bacterium]
MADKNSDGRIYAFGYSEAAIGLMENRTAAANAGFLLPHLDDDAQVLDIGCGPGTITTGLAEAVPEGQATGLDIEPGQVAMARERATQDGLTNCRFDTGSVLDLPYEDATFDAVFGHTILMQFSDPAPVLAEVRRVLKPGGLAAFRELDFAGSLYGPAGGALEAVFSTLRRAILENDGYPDIGRDLLRHCVDAGFELLYAKPVYFCPPLPQGRAGLYAAMSKLWQQADFVQDAIAAGWLSEEDRQAIETRLVSEAEDEGFISGTTYVEVLAKGRDSG